MVMEVYLIGQYLMELESGTTVKLSSVQVTKLEDRVRKITLIEFMKLKKYVGEHRP